MKKTLAAAMLVAAMAGSTFAQTPSTSRPMATPSTSSPTTPYEGKMAPGATTAHFQARNIIGASVKSTTGGTVGDVKELLITSPNHVTQAIISVGGILGLGDTLVAVPYDNLAVSRTEDKLHVVYATTKAELEKMPKFTYAQMPVETTTVQASKLLGTNIKNTTGNTIGDIKDLIITGDDKVPQAIISVGGFLGIGDKLVAVPYNDLSISRVENEQRIVYNATKEQLKAMPTYIYN